MEERREKPLGENFDFPPLVLDEIQKNIEEIILNFDIPDANKFDVIKKINFMYSQTRYMSVTDPLTGLYNRRHFEECLEREFLRAKRYKSDLSFAIIDIDFFKNVNDTYGHSAGDYVLKDYVFRYNGNQIDVTISIGVCEADNNTDTVHKLFENADKALYKAKENGRNQIMHL